MYVKVKKIHDGCAWESPMLSEVYLPGNPNLSANWFECNPVVPKHYVESPEEGKKWKKHDSAIGSLGGTAIFTSPIIIMFSSSVPSNDGKRIDPVVDLQGLQEVLCRYKNM